MCVHRFVNLYMAICLLCSCASVSLRDSGESPSQKVKLLNDIGGKFYATGNYRDAKAYFTLALKLEPSYVDALVNRSATYNRLGDYENAIRDATKAIKMQPSSVPAHNNRANAYSAQGKFSRALADYQESYRLSPGFLDVVFNIANLYYRLNLRLDAVRYYTRALEIHPGLTEAYIFRAVALSQLGYNKRADADFNTVMRMQARSPHINLILARALMQTKNFAEAEDVLSEMIDQNPEDYEAYFTRAETLYNLKDYSSAYDDIMRAIELKNNIAYQALRMKIEKKMRR